jgi:2-keto-4-pentenoate hydratase/2-oxohepta-3-ene-1,7-dioic acid hydratase in catechol pathway
LSYRGSGQGFYKLQLAYPQGESFNSDSHILPLFNEVAMRLATIRTPEGPRAAVLRGDAYVDLYATDSTLPSSVRELLAGGPAALYAAERTAQARKIVTHPADRVQLLSPVPDPQKIVCLGLNYRDHAIESGAPIPSDPILFSKYATALVGHGEAIVLPAISNEVDYEAELVVVVGKQGRQVRVDAAMSYVAGYTIGHDVSARDWQLKKDGKQWMAGKTFDTFAPTGPVLVTADEAPDPHALRIRLRLNGQTMQDGMTAAIVPRQAFEQDDNYRAVRDFARARIRHGAE